MTTTVQRFTQGDRFPSVLATFSYADAALSLSDDLTGSETVTFTMRAVDLATPTIVDGSATFVSSSSGIITLRYDWQAGDTDRVGEYQAQFKVALSGGRYAHAPSGGYLRIVVIDGGTVG